MGTGFSCIRERLFDATKIDFSFKTCRKVGLNLVYGKESQILMVYVLPSSFSIFRLFKKEKKKKLVRRLTSQN